MARATEQKIRLLALYDFLRSNTDEDNPLTTQEIIKALESRGITVSRKTLYDDIDLLNKYGYDVVCVRGRSNHYFVGERQFQRPEVQVLLSAIGATQALSANKTEIIIQKLLELLGIGEANQLCDIVPTSDARHNNERVYYSIDAITTALLKKKKLLFKYFDYGVNGQREYRRGGHRYVINPLGMAYSNDQLYLVGYHDNHGGLTHYRIDRMDEVEVMKKKIVLKPEFENFDMNAYRQELFDMYSGERQKVELLFPQDLLEIAIDRFGEGITPVANGDGNYKIGVTVSVSKTFFAWLTTFEGRVGIVAPQSTREQYHEFIKKLSKVI